MSILSGSVSALAMLALSTSANAGAFQLNERSAKVTGASLSGSVSAASDVTFATFNPAALTKVEGFEAGGSLSLVAPKSNGTVETGPFAGASLDADRVGVLASGAAAYRVNEWLVVGLTNYVPFGLRTAYDPNSVVAFDALTSDLKTVVIAPTFSFDVADNLALGFSADILYVDARLTSAAVNLDGDDVTVGFSIGALWEPIPGTQIGAAYHSGFDARVDTAVFGGAFPAFLGLEGTVEASLPGWAHLGITQSITDDWRVMAEGRWVNWSEFDSIDLFVAGTVIPDEQNYNDALVFALGTEYDVLDSLTLRTGIAWDETPTSDAFRTPRVPDEDRIWISGGLSFNLSDSMTIDASYSYLRALRDSDVTLDAPGPFAGTQISYEGGAHIVSVGGSLKF